MKENFDIFLIVMALLAAVVYAALHFFEAGYGYLFDRRYGPPVPNRVGWMVMESPVFILMCVLWASSERMWQAGPLALFCLFQAHYLQRAFIFPLLIRGKGRMPLGIVVMGMVFNTLNALMQGGWIFYVSPADYYAGWFAQPYIYIGGALFVAGMAVNLHSDHIIRHLRRPGDTRHYIPRGGMFRYVSSANYFGELLEWVGIRRSLVVVGRNGLRMVDLRQPRTARRIAAPPLRAGVRRRVFAPSPQTDHPLHLLTRLKGGVQVADGPLQRFSPSSAPAGLRRRLQGRRKNFTFRNEVCASDFQPSTSNSQLSIQCPLHFSPLIN